CLVKSCSSGRMHSGISSSARRYTVVIQAPSRLHRHHLRFALANTMNRNHEVAYITFRQQVAVGSWRRSAMRRFAFSLVVGTLATAAHGCGSTTTELSADGAVPAASSFASTGLPGAWKGFFMTTSSIGDSRMIQGDYTFKITEDGTYSGTRISRLVAGTSRGGQTKISGRVIVKGNRVIFEDDAGWQMDLVRKGDTLYGVNADPGTQWRIALEMDKVPTAAGVPLISR